MPRGLTVGGANNLHRRWGPYVSMTQMAAHPILMAVAIVELHDPDTERRRSVCPLR